MSLKDIPEVWTLPNHCKKCGGEWLEFFADDEYVYHKCINCDNKVKVPV